MEGNRFEKVFPEDCISKRERVGLTLAHKPVDRVALHEQLSYNPRVVAEYTGKSITGFAYDAADVGMVIRQTMDMCFPPLTPHGTGLVTDRDGFVDKKENWTVWHVSRPFSDSDGAAGWLRRVLERTIQAAQCFRADTARRDYRLLMEEIQRKVGETVVCDYSGTGFNMVFDRMGLELYSYFGLDYPDLLEEFMVASTDLEIMRVNAVADPDLSPVILIPEDFSTKQGPIFSPEYLHRFHYPFVERLATAWHDAGYVVLYHSDGNYRKAIPDLIDRGVDGFYCLEPGCGMDIVELKNRWPGMVWAGGIDGVDLMERGSPAEVRDSVHRQIRETGALATGGMFVASSSEINPPIPPANFRAMVEATGELRNNAFVSSS